MKDLPREQEEQEEGEGEQEEYESEEFESEKSIVRTSEFNYETPH